MTALQAEREMKPEGFSLQLQQTTTFHISYHHFVSFPFSFLWSQTLSNQLREGEAMRQRGREGDG